MRCIILSTILMISSSAAFAQVEAQAEPSREQRQAEIRRLNQSADNDARTGFLGSGVQLSAGSDTSNVSLTLARSWDARSERNYNFTTAALTLTAPISDSARKEGVFITEGGLPNSYSLQLALSRAWIANPAMTMSSERVGAIYSAAVAECQRLNVTAAARQACAGLPADQLHQQHYMSDADYNASMSGYADNDLWLTGLTGSIGTREFSFRHLSDFMEDKARRTEYALSAFVGVAPRSRTLYLGAGYEYRRQYKNVRARTLCPTPAPGAVLECFTASYGEPERSIDSNIFALARWQGGIRLLGSDLPLGVELRATYDTRDNVFGLALPIYFISGSDGALRGGVRFDWQNVDNRDERFGFRVFVGTSFRLLGG